MSDEIEPPRRQDAKPAIPPLTGEVTWCGDMTVNGDHCRGVFVEISKEQLIRDEQIPLFCECVVITAAQFKELTAERDALQIQHGTCSVCGFVAWKERGEQQDCQYCAATAERDALKTTLASADREIERLNLMVQMMDELAHEVRGAGLTTESTEATEENTQA